MLSKLDQTIVFLIAVYQFTTPNECDSVTEKGTVANHLSDDIRLAISGDSSAWNRLYIHYRPVLISAARHQVSTADISHSDLVQEAWIRIYSGLHSFKGLESDKLSLSFFVWLRQVARNTFRNIIVAREAKKRNPSSGKLVPGDIRLPDPAPTPSSIVSRNEQELLIHSALLRLETDLDRQIIQLSIWEGHTLKTISEVIGMEYTKLRRRYQSILKALQSEVESCL